MTPRSADGPGTCPSCGGPLPHEAIRFCVTCGASLPTLAWHSVAGPMAPASAATPTRPATPATPTTTAAPVTLAAVASPNVVAALGAPAGGGVAGAPAAVAGPGAGRRWRLGPVIAVAVELGLSGGATGAIFSQELAPARQTGADLRAAGRAESQFAGFAPVLRQSV